MFANVSYFEELAGSGWLFLHFHSLGWSEQENETPVRQCWYHKALRSTRLLLPHSPKATGTCMPAGRQWHTLRRTQKCLRTWQTTTLHVFGSCLRRVFMPLSQSSPGTMDAASLCSLWYPHQSPSRQPSAGAVTPLSAKQIFAPSELGWIFLRSLTSNFRVISLQNLLLLLSFFPNYNITAKSTYLPANIFKRDTRIISACKPSLSAET